MTSTAVGKGGWKYLERPQIDNDTRALFEQYAGIPSEEVESHICALRDQAWAIHNYPCIGRFGFLERSVLDHPAYIHVLSLLKSGHTYLDLGCCFGQDIRKLVFAGAPPDRLAGADLEPKFWELGYDLFRDRDRLPSKFYQLDLFDVESLKSVRAKASGGAGQANEGGFDVVHASSMFHLFDWDKQLEVMTNTVTYLLRKQPRSMIFGRQVGTDKPGAYDSSSSGNAKMYQHSEETQRRMWEAIEAKTGVNFRVEVDLVDWQRPRRLDIEGTTTRMLRFAAMIQ